MKSLLVIMAATAFVAGGMVGCSAEAVVPPPDAPGTAVAAPPSFRPVSEELELIEAQGGWELRKAMLDVRPVTLQVGPETLIYAPRISWKPEENLDLDFQFYRLVGGVLEQVEIKKN